MQKKRTKKYRKGSVNRRYLRHKRRLGRYARMIVPICICLLGIVIFAGIIKDIINIEQPADVCDSNDSNDIIEWGISNADSEYEYVSNINTADNGAYGEEHTREEYILDVPYIYQKDDFPTGCESVSAVMLLKYYGISISVDEFIENYLELGNYYWDDEGVMHAAHPAEKFIGNPRENTGFGCYAPVIEKAVKRILADEESILSVRLTTGSELEKLCRLYIDNDKPVLVWASMGMKPTREGRSWILENGESFTWIAGEHCLVLVGYDDEYYYLNDPLVGKAVAYERELVESRYRELGSQSLVIE